LIHVLSSYTSHKETQEVTSPKLLETVLWVSLTGNLGSLLHLPKHPFKTGKWENQHCAHYGGE